MSDQSKNRQPSTQAPPEARQRRPATAREAKALSHPLRLRILRLCGLDELTNKQLADRLEQDPGTVLYHVRQLVNAGFLEQGDVRTGTSGALEKPYRSTGRSWWLSDALTGTESDAAMAPVEAFQEELREAGPESISTLARFTLHLSPDDARVLDERLQELLDEYISTDDERSHLPVHGGIVVLHSLRP
ncbi:helix-turn-helix transcriptional regulator [Arthrobacter echini]|uniref:Helix-turn-helix transcriptional regulator n=1 Tax=Arthrobacter echini TaxID=1529066 RepID=A0A4S5E195_9MICC|nr:winged helix-turn-helix domain-containing protein [Arthrobacter echini]THJ65115.1 helix-turn-helix transcriptional regulator [Arthrobacter echini]